MPTFIAGLFLLYLVLAAIKQFGRLTPADAARIMRKGGVAVGLLGMALSLFRGRFGFAGMLASALLGMAGKGGSNFSGAFRSTGFAGAKAKVATERSAAIEMRLDVASGAMNGTVLSGPRSGAELASLTRTDLMELYRWCLGDDPDGALLLEAYLDRRFAGWRQADQGQANGRNGGGVGAGAMSRNEAYEILGLPEGASAEEIVAAHRGLMKKFHPDHGGSTTRAARINQAKDVLLDRHG